MLGNIIAFIRLIVLFCWVIPFILPAVIVLCLKKRSWHNVLQVTCFKGALKIFGFSVQVNRTNFPKEATLFVSNHTSYMDIPVLGSLVPLRFTPKKVIKRWPLIGLLTDLTRAVYIERQAKESLKQREELSRLMEAGDNIMLFPESTTNDGTKLLPFKSALFEAANSATPDSPIRVVPISFAYTHANGKVLAPEQYQWYSWFGDIALVPHLWRLLKIRSTIVTVFVHEPINYKYFDSRKALATHCFHIVERGIEKIRKQAELNSQQAIVEI